MEIFYFYIWGREEKKDKMYVNYWMPDQINSTKLAQKSSDGRYPYLAI